MEGKSSKESARVNQSPQGDQVSDATSSSVGRRTVLRSAVGAIAATALLTTTKQVQAADGGEELWRFESDDIISTGPTVVDGTVYATADRSLFAIDAETGEEDWEYRDNGSSQSPTVVDGKTFIGTANNGIQINDAETGDLETHFLEDAEGSLSDHSGVVADGTVYGVEDINVPNETILRAFDVETGDEQWSVVTEGSFRTPVPVGDTIYISDNDGEVLALDAGDGSEQWHTQVAEDDPSTRVSELNVVDGTVYVNTSDGSQDIGPKIHALDADTGDSEREFESPWGTISEGVTIVGDMMLSSDGDTIGAIPIDGEDFLWEYDLGETVNDMPTVADGVGYAGDREGTLHAFDVTDGEQLWSVDIADEAINTSPIVVDGVVYVCCDMEEDGLDSRGDLVAIEAEGTGSSVDSRVLQGTHNHHHEWTGDASPIVNPHWGADEEENGDGEDDDTSETGNGGDQTDDGATSPDDTEVDDSLPGFGIGAGLVGLGGAGYLIKKWRTEK